MQTDELASGIRKLIAENAEMISVLDRLHAELEAERSRSAELEKERDCWRETYRFAVQAKGAEV